MRIRRMIAWLPGVDGERPPTDFELLRAAYSSRCRSQIRGNVDREEDLHVHPEFVGDRWTLSIAVVSLVIAIGSFAFAIFG